MLSRDRPVHQRLRFAFALFVGLLLLVFWLLSVAYYYLEEREDALESAAAQATMVATQSSAAVMFDDRDLLNAQLSLLSILKDVRWALITVPDAQQGERVIAHYASVPGDYAALQRTLSQARRWDIGIARFRVAEPITHNGVQRGTLHMEIDFEQTLRNLLAGAVGSLALGLFLLWLGSRVFDRILATVTGPVGELVALADRVTAEGITQNRAGDTGRDEIGRLARAFNHMLDVLASREEDLARSRDELRALAASLQQVRETERTRISHEIHDELGQRMTAIKYEIARQTEGQVREQLSSMVDDTIKVVRSISWELRPSLLDALGLLAAIEWLAQEFTKRTGIDCTLSLPEEEVPLNPECATDLFRIAQELLTNVARHARARRVDLHLTSEDGQYVLEVEDDGVGFEAGVSASDDSALGLLGLRERALRWGGHVEITSDQMQGSRIRVCLPIGSVTSQGDRRR